MALGTLSRDEIDNIFNQAQAQPTPESVPGATLQASKSEIDAVFTPQKPQSQSKSRRKNRKLNDIEAAREAGRQSLADAQAGRLSAFDNGYSVAGASEWDRIPTLDEPTQEYSRGGYSPNEQRDMVRALMGQAEANKRRNAQNISPILGTANREGLLSEQDQKQVDKLNRRINALQNVSTGDVAIDDIAAQNNQQKIAELQNQVDRIYQLNRSSDDQNIDRMLEPGYKASKAERQYANDLFDAYLEQNPKAKELYNTNDAAMSSALALRMSPEEMQEYARMVSLKDKMSPGYAFGQGLTQSMPFVQQLENKSDDIASQLWGYDQDKYGVEAQRQNASTQNKGAELAGNALYQLGQYAAFAPAIESIPGVQNVSQGVGKALSFGNEALAKGIGNVVSGQASDMLLDTLPNAVIPAVMEGRWGDVLPDALKNQGENLAFNALGEFGGAALNLLRGGNIPKLDAPASQADEVADALRQTEELNPVDLARQNASGVDEIAQSQRQAAENLDELSRRVPPTEDDGFRLESDPYDDFDFDDELDDFAEEVSEKVHWNDDGTATITRQDGSRYMEYPDGHTEELPRLEEPTPAQAPTQNIPEVSQPEAKPRVDLASMTKKQRKEYLKTDSNLTYNKMKRQIISRLKDYDMPDAVAKEFDDVISKQDEFIRRMDEATTEEEMGAIWQDIMTTLRGSLDNIKAAATNSDGSMSNAVFRKRDYGVRDATWKEFSDATKGVTIRVPDDIRADLTDYPTIRDLNNAVFLRKGMPTLTFAKGKGIGADQVFSELDEAMNGQLSSFARSHGYNPDIRQDQINAICEYAKSIKAPAPEEAIDRDVMDLAIETMSNDVLANLEKHSRAKSKWLTEHADDFKPVVDEIPGLDDAATRVNNADNDVFASTSSDELVRGEDGMMHIPGVEEAPEQAVRQEIPSFDNPTPGSKNSKLGTNTMMKVDPERAAKELSGGLYEYVPVTEQETMREAARAVSNNPDAAYNDVLNLDTKSYTAADVDKSMMLRAHLQDQLAEAKAAGDASRQLILSSRLNELTLQQRRMATNGGQVTQAWAKWSRNNADGALFTGESMAARNYDKAVKGDKNLENNVHEVVTDIRNNLEKLNGNKSMPDADGLGKSGSRTMAEDEGLGSGNPYWDELVNKAKSGELDDVSEEDLSANIQDMIRGILDDKANAKVKRNLEDKNIRKISDTLAAEIKQNEDIEATLDMLDMAGVTGFTGFDDSVEQEIREIFKEAEQYGFNSRQRVDLENQAYAKIANALNYSGSWHDKIDSLRYFAMLANPKTHIRNTVGNMSFRQLTNFKDNLAGALEGIVDRASKAAGKGGIERTTTFINKVGADKPLYDASYKNADSVARLLEGGDKYTSARQGIEGQKATWGYSKAGQAVNKVQGANTNLLELEDTLALRRKYADSLTRYLKANGADESIFQATDDASIELLQKAQAHAIDEAKKATFHQDNAVAESMSKFVKDAREIDLSDSVGAKKKAGNLGKKVLGFITNALLPFKKTPLNILTSVAEYSPVNLAAVGMDAYKLAKGTGTAAELIDDIAKTMTGTGILALGYAGAKEGLITGAYDPDRGQQDQLEGKQEYALKIGDKSYTLNWNSPSLTMLLSGANLADASDLSVSEMLSLIAKAGDPVLEETMLSSLADALSSAKYAEDSGEVLAQFGTTTAKNYVSQFIPTELGNISRSIDNTRRSTYTEKTGAAGTVDRTIKNIQNKIPGLSQNNEPYLNAWGEEQQNLKGDNNLLGRLAYNHLSPGYYSEEDISDTDAYLDSLYEQTGDTTLFPKVASNTLDGERLTPEAYTARSRAQGQAAKDLIDTMRQDPEMMQLSPKTQADIVAKIYAESKEIGKNAVNGESGYDADSIIDDLKREYTFKEKGLVGSTGSAYSSQSAIDAWENRDLDRYQEYRNFLNESGKSDNIDNWNKYKEGGAQAFTEKKTETKKPAQTTVPTVDTGDINWSSYGITNNYANEAYAKAKGEIPSLTPQVYANTFKSIDTSGNSKVTQDEVIAYLNNIGASDSQGQQIWAAYGSNNWKKIPVLGDNGTWKKK